MKPATRELLHSRVREKALRIPSPSKAVRGLHQLFLKCAALAAHYMFERGQQDTSWLIYLTEYGLDAPGRGKYAPSDWMFVPRALRGCTITGSDVFVDFGSGMGRIVCQVACRYPFGRVIGVELVPEFTSIAQSNLELVKDRVRARSVEFVTADVLEYEIPNDLTYAYFYNPFTGDIFRCVIDRIVDSLQRNPRLIRLIYAGPVMEDYILGTRRFRRVRTSRGLRLNEKVSLYESVTPWSLQHSRA